MTKERAIKIISDERKCNNADCDLRCDKCEYGIRNFQDFLDAAYLLADIFTNQPEIIHCEDCKHVLEDDYVGRYWCDRKSGIFAVNKDSFCSFGRRKEDEER